MGNRRWTLAYVGNQYDRDDCFDRFFAPAAAAYPEHVVAGKWTDTTRWPHVRFLGRIPFPQVTGFYRMSLTTILLLPDRHLAAGQMPQRLFEAVLAGCLPLCPAEFRSANQLIPDALIVSSGAEATAVIADLAAARPSRRADLLAACLQRLDLMRASRQVKILEEILAAGADR